MALREYLYVDAHRLNSYVEQIASPMIHERVPVYKVGASLTGPSGSREQTIVSRPHSMHEKIELLLDHLSESSYFARGRPIVIPEYPNDRWLKVVFYLETVVARRVVIPGSKSINEGRALRLWVAEWAQANSLPCTELALIEDFPKDDWERAICMTSYSAFLALLGEFRDALDRTIAPVDVLLEEAGLEMVEGSKELRPKGDYDAAFARQNDLLGLLRAVGSHVGPPREIEVLYRIRSVGNVMAHIFGYPIFIREASVTHARAQSGKGEFFSPPPHTTIHYYNRLYLTSYFEVILTFIVSITSDYDNGWWRYGTGKVLSV